jgi:hypothetical protein
MSKESSGHEVTFWQCWWKATLVIWICITAIVMWAVPGVNFIAIAIVNFILAAVCGFPAGRLLHAFYTKRID